MFVVGESGKVKHFGFTFLSIKDKAYEKLM